jgi:hypothetical protein
LIRKVLAQHWQLSLMISRIGMSADLAADSGTEMQQLSPRFTIA